MEEIRAQLLCQNVSISKVQWSNNTQWALQLEA